MGKVKKCHRNIHTTSARAIHTSVETHQHKNLLDIAQYKRLAPFFKRKVLDNLLSFGVHSLSWKTYRRNRRQVGVIGVFCSDQKASHNKPLLPIPHGVVNADAG